MYPTNRARTFLNSRRYRKGHRTDFRDNQDILGLACLNAPFAHQSVLGKSCAVIRVPIGEYRDGAYRVRRDLLKAWGGLTVNNGYIQRSGTLSSFLHPEKFCNWFTRQHVELIAENNPET